MTAYLVRRSLQTIPLLFLVTFMSYSLVLLLPGDPVSAFLSGGEGGDPEVRAQMRRDLNLDKSIPEQYALWLKKIVIDHDLGKSVGSSRRPIAEELQSRIPATLQIGLGGMLVGLLIGIPAGIIAAAHHNSRIDRLVTMISVAGVALPGFWFGIMLILLFSVQLHWLPPFGYASIFEDPVQALKLMVLPCTVIGWELSAIITRQLRSSMLEVLRQDYVRTARAKGLNERRVVWMHALRNAVLPIVTVVGLLLGRVLAGSVVVETVFAIPGIGRMLVTAINQSDFPAVQAIVLVVALSVVAMNLFTDMVYVVIDPRIRLS